MAVIEVQNVWKKYPHTWALRDVSFSAPEGKVVGILGENGSGKSTLFRILMGLARPTRGEVRVFGEPPSWRTRARIAYLPEVDTFYRWMRIPELFRFVGAFYEGWDMDKAMELLSRVRLNPNVRIGELSKGQRARLKLVLAFAWPADLLLLDEPLSGIDPASRLDILDLLLREYRFGEQTILISTHLVRDVETFLDDVMFLKEGEIVLSGAADDLRASYGKSLEEIFREVYA